MLVHDRFHQFMCQEGLHHAAPSFAVAVSGGADSLCLALVAHRWVQSHGGRLVALTVDHQLRPEAAQEADQVKAWLTARGIPHETLRWEGPKPAAGVQERARKARYELLLQACKDRGLQALFLGHHQEDQHETFFMRLAAGSGPTGLAGMPAVSVWQGIRVLRPFLILSPQELKAELRLQGQAWIEDPSNQNPGYTRVRLRQCLAKEGLSLARLDRTLAQFQEDRQYFDAQTDEWCAAHVKGQPPLFQHVGSLAALLDLHPALAKRILNRLLQDIRGRSYPLGARRLDRLWDTLCASSFSATTVGGCYLLKRKGGLHIQRELRAIQGPLSTDRLPQMWDGRIVLASEVLHHPGDIRPLGSALVPSLKKRITSPIPSVVWPTLPTVWQEDRVIEIPHLQVGSL